MIIIEGLCKRYGAFVAVDNLSFEVGDGEVLGLVGPNGAGKTTTMRCLTGIIPSDEGRIRIDGHDLRDAPVEAKRSMAFVPAEVRVFDHLTVREHLIFFQRLYNGQHSADPEAPDRLLAELELADKTHILPGALSRGMKQKLMIGCALIHNPKVLIMDEPFTGLDPHAIRRMRDILRERAAAGSVVVISSHLLGMVEDFVSRILIIQNGKDIAHGTMSELRARLPSMLDKAGLEEIFINITSGERREVPS